MQQIRIHHPLCSPRYGRKA